MQSGIRRVYFYDLELGVNKEKATPPPMDDVLRAIKARVDARQAVHPINKRTAHLEIGDMTVDSVNNCAILLLKISDTTLPDPYFSNPNAGTSRVARKEDGEGRGFGAHLLISTLQESDRPNHYLALLEKNQGLHRSFVERLLQAVLRGQYKEDEDSFSCADSTGARNRDGKSKLVKFRPMITFTGHPSETLIQELDGGTIKDIVLTKDNAMVPFGSQVWLKSSESTLRLKASARGPLTRVIDSVRSALKEPDAKQYQKARVRFVKPDKTTDSVEFDLTTGNPIDEKYVKSRLISDIEPIMDDSSDSIVEHFSDRLVVELKGHRAAGGSI